MISHCSAIHFTVSWPISSRKIEFLIGLKPVTKFVILRCLSCKFLAKLDTPALQSIHFKCFQRGGVRLVLVSQYDMENGLSSPVREGCQTETAYSSMLLICFAINVNQVQMVGTKLFSLLKIHNFLFPLVTRSSVLEDQDISLLMTKPSSLVFSISCISPLPMVYVGWWIFQDNFISKGGAARVSEMGIGRVQPRGCHFSQVLTIGYWW